MGALCPICLTQQPFRKNITVNQAPAFKARDVIARELGCGHVIGGEEYAEFSKIVEKANVKAAHELRIIEEERKKAISLAWKQMNEKAKGGA